MSRRPSTPWSLAACGPLPTGPHRRRGRIVALHTSPCLPPLLFILHCKHPLSPKHTTRCLYASLSVSTSIDSPHPTLHNPQPTPHISGPHRRRGRGRVLSRRPSARHDVARQCVQGVGPRQRLVQRDARGHQRRGLLCHRRCVLSRWQAACDELARLDRTSVGPGVRTEYPHNVGPPARRQRRLLLGRWRAACDRERRLHREALGPVREVPRDVHTAHTPAVLRRVQVRKPPCAPDKSSSPSASTGKGPEHCIRICKGRPQALHPHPHPHLQRKAPNIASTSASANSSSTKKPPSFASASASEKESLKCRIRRVCKPIIRRGPPNI
eukprot:364688-Chlamydomonas_euryale.AAC.2